MSTEPGGWLQWEELDPRNLDFKRGTAETPLNKIKELSDKFQALNAQFLPR